MDTLPLFQYNQALHITQLKTKPFGTQTKNNWIILTGSSPPNNKMLNISHKSQRLLFTLADRNGIILFFVFPSD